ncbi:cytosolic purine 5'-nucleotidase isoform X2 [Selaginella moellendorffii]|uniref:cytosolic purine 5'-nucleotidase isoform X2 n=1 Tax=Selaginella moellendorffii TaxID=88036 RepID=UPI000D1CC66D|nr:cytosolic purine 5'-nucleotidase isoform X2 [Selaginella moellendorffii]|eukprot:XP_024520230.1 cytosolic purine 5'-nucleotidase isoform X2 [Selaginella moellendorffii]
MAMRDSRMGVVGAIVFAKNHGSGSSRSGILAPISSRRGSLAQLRVLSVTKGGNENTVDDDRSPRRNGSRKREQVADKFDVVRNSSDSKFDIDYLGESTMGDMTVKREDLGSVDLAPGSIEELAREEAREAECLLEELNVPAQYPHGIASRGIFCSRTLNLRSIAAIGYDMDYTLIQYNVNAWEGRAYKYGMDNLRSMGYPVDGLKFDPELVIRGLIMDKEKGNLVKADRFGYVKRAMHGTRMVSNRTISEIYGRELVDLRNENRWEFLNTLFSVSEAVMYMQMVDRLDEGAIPPQLGPLDYNSLYKVVAKALFRAHVEGRLKAEIVNEPERFVEPDAELPLTLLDQREAGKKLLLITNSDYQYTSKMMQYAYNQFLPNNMDWRDLFDMLTGDCVREKARVFPNVTSLVRDRYQGWLDASMFQSKPSAQMVEQALGVHGDETLYVGDHIYTDVSQSKVHLRWRTALICSELEKEVNALAYGKDHRAKLIELMNQKEVVGDVFNQLRLALQRRNSGREAQTNAATTMDTDELADSMQNLLVLMTRIDQKIAPMLEADGEYFNKRWGYLSRAGLWDKSHLMRQIEKYADIYTSRVSNFLRFTPFMYFRSQAQSLAHDCHSNWFDMSTASFPRSEPVTH